MDRYACPVCASEDPNAYHRCYRPSCPDGRDPRPKPVPQNMRKTRGYAYRDGDGRIMVETVSPTSQAAKVNTIVIASYRHIIPRQGASDDEIERLFISATGGAGRVVPVSIYDDSEEEE